MAYVLNDKIKIDKPIVFLCGPYYNDSDKHRCTRGTNKIK